MGYGEVSLSFALSFLFSAQAQLGPSPPRCGGVYITHTHHTHTHTHTHHTHNTHAHTQHTHIHTHTKHTRTHTHTYALHRHTHTHTTHTRPPHTHTTHTHTHHTHTIGSSGCVISSSQRPLPTQHTTNTKEEYPCCHWDSNPLFQASSNRTDTGIVLHHLGFIISHCRLTSELLV
jgi:hypothetical protein